MPSGCAPPPYLAKTVPLMKVVGSLTVRRSLFGYHMYDIVMGGKTVVPLDSGYLGLVCR